MKKLDETLVKQRFGPERRTRSLFWTSHSSAALGEQSGDRASVPSGAGSFRTAVKAHPMQAIANHAASAELRMLRNPEARRRFVADVGYESRS
jgi:hypothetical protein